MPANDANNPDVRFPTRRTLASRWDASWFVLFTGGIATLNRRLMADMPPA